jgi:hypothetical protein
MTKETIHKKTKTMLIERDRTHYARSYGDPERIRVNEPLAVDLEMPMSYARDLLAALRRVIATGGEFESAQIALDIPIRLYLRPLQVEQIVEQIAKIAGEPR